MKYLGLEAGGTKFVMGLGNEHGQIVERHRFDTRDPESTLKEVVAFIQAKTFYAIGIASFGPLDLKPHSATYGNITSTPKPGWANTPLLKRIQEVFNGPIGIDTDVNGAAIAEAKWGAGKDLHSLVYLTIGTGIGAGIVVEGKPVHGLLHPEFGHISLRSHPQDDFKGVCPYHAYCFEGLASGPSIEGRFQQKADQLDEHHDAWIYESYYIGQACANLALTLAPEKIILGGGVMHQVHLLPRIYETFKSQLNGYIQIPAMIENSSYLSLPGLGDDAGLLGALALAHQAWLAKD